VRHVTTISFFGHKIHINGSQEINTPLLLAFHHFKFLFSHKEKLMSSQKTVLLLYSFSNTYKVLD